MGITIGCIGVVAIILAFIELLRSQNTNRLFYILGITGYLLCQIGVCVLYATTR